MLNITKKGSSGYSEGPFFFSYIILFLNAMEIVFIIGFIQAFFLTALILIKKNKMLADYVLAAWILFMGIHALSGYSWEIGLNKDYPYLTAISRGFAMLEGAFAFVYVSVITSKIQQFKWQYLINIAHYSGFTIIIITLMLFNVDLTPQEVLNDINQGYFMSVLDIFNIFLGPIYLILCLFKLRTHRRNIANNFSYTDNIDLKWLNYIVTIMFIFWIAEIIIAVLAFYMGIIDPVFANNFIYTILIISIFCYGFFGIKQQVIYAHQPEKKKKSSIDKRKKQDQQYQRSGLKKEDSEEYLSVLLKYMESEEPFLNGKLSLKEIATDLEISTNHLSQVINENLDKNFFDFVNEYRVNLIKEKMGNPENRNYTLLALAFDSGFNSKSSFNTIFKKHTGITPSQYLKTC